MIRNIATTYLARFSSLLTTLLLLPIIVHWQGSMAYGLYAITISLGLLFQQDLGMSGATTKFVSEAYALKERERCRSIIASSSLVYLLIGLFAATGVFLTLPLVFAGSDVPIRLQSSIPLFVALGSLQVFFALTIAPLRQALAGMGELNTVNMGLSAQAVFRLLATTAAMLTGFDVSAVLIVDLMSLLLLGSALAVYRKLRHPGYWAPPWQANIKTLRQIWRLSVPLLVMALGSTVVLQMGTVLAGMFLSLTAAAGYAAAQRIYLLAKEVTGSLSGALLPTLSGSYARGNTEQARAVYCNGTALANFAMLIAVVPLVAFVHEVIALWVGDELVFAAPATVVLLVSLLANNNHLLAIPALTARGAVNGFAGLHALWAISAIALSLLLVRDLGVLGIALGVGVPIVLLEPFYVRIATGHLDIPGRSFVVQAIAKPAGVLSIPGAAMVVFGWCADWSPAVVVWALLVWLAVALALGWIFVFTEEVKTRLVSIRGFGRRGK